MMIIIIIIIIIIIGETNVTPISFKIINTFT